MSAISGPAAALIGVHRSSYDDIAVPKPRMRWWIGVGVLLASAVGGVFGILAFRMTASRPISIPSAASPPRPSAAVSMAPAPFVEANATLSITSEPTGATIREDGNELCAATPCALSFRGEAATRVHQLVIQKPGFQRETKSVKPSDASSITVRLAKLGGGPPAPANQGATRYPKNAASPGSPPTPEKAEPSTPDGFKELPY